MAGIRFRLDRHQLQAEIWDIFISTTMVSDGIRNALGKNVTKNWSEWFPEHYCTDPKSSVEIEGKAPVINEENDFLYFFKPEHEIMMDKNPIIH